jgi:protein tyrosine phosphatase type 4A
MSSLSLISPITHIEYKDRHFLITESPTQTTLNTYTSVLQRENCKCLVRAYIPTYSSGNEFKQKDVTVIDLPFEDGSAPNQEIIDQWLSIVDSTNGKVATECLAGLGRSAVLVAIALIELGCEYHNAIKIIRKKRRGAFNHKQIEFLESYKSRRHSVTQCCTII